MNIQWYPGHMTKAMRQMNEDIKLVDLIIEIADARVPVSSRNPDLSQMGAGKARIILLNKADLADERQNKRWEQYYKENNVPCILADSRKRTDLKRLAGIVQEACREKIERDLRRGIKNRPVKAMVVGIPNVGKSTFINSYVGRASAKTGNKPGVTKGKQWVNLGKSILLLDTPGVLWAKFEDPKAGVNLALIGSIKDDVVNTGELCIELLKFLSEKYPDVIKDRYGIEDGDSPVDILREIAVKRGCITKGNEVSYEKTAALVLDEFRSGKLGRITLESAPGGNV